MKKRIKSHFAHTNNRSDLDFCLQTKQHISADAQSDLQSERRLRATYQAVL